MVQTTNRIFDEMARLMNDAAGVASGVRREFDTVFRTQAERILRDLDVVQREEFEAVKEMARLAREENEALKARIEALEGRPGGRSGGRGRPGRPRRSSKGCRCNAGRGISAAFSLSSAARAAISRPTQRHLGPRPNGGV